ncbi:MAG: hypothetical protein M1839_009507 [Geoglossum umbratile]|nr:MAG: hypothetical protein M1839_009507 [Geoglossum umbratile]
MRTGRTVLESYITITNNATTTTPQTNAVALRLGSAAEFLLVCAGALPLPLPLPTPLLVEAGENSRAQDSSSESSSPALFVTVIGGQENPDSDSLAKTVFVMVLRDVLVFVIVIVVVIVRVGKQENCLGLRALLELLVVGLGLALLVVLGGMNESEQPVSSCSVAFALLVTVKGAQVKSGLSGGLDVSVMVTVVVVLIVKSVVAVAVSVATRGHPEQ